MNPLLQYLLDRLKEPSTWRGAVWLITVTLATGEPESAEEIAKAGATIAGAMGILLRDNPWPKTNQ